MSISWDKRTKRWRFYFDRTIGSQRARSSKLLPKGWSHTQARAYDKNEEARLYGIATGIERVDERPLIARAIELYVEYRVPALRDGKHTAQELAHVLPWIQGKTLADLGDVSRDYAKENPELSRATIRNRLAYLRAAVRYAFKKHRFGYAGATDQMEIPTPDNERHVYLRPHELQRFLSKLEHQDARDLYTLAFYTGLRWRANLLPLTKDKIIRRGGDVWLDVGRTKNGRPIMVPVHPEAREALRSIPFPRKDREYYDHFHAARAAVKRPDVRPHDLRHSLAAALASNGASLREIGEVLGHKSVQATQRYAHLYPERVAEIVGRVPSVRFSRTKVSREAGQKGKKVA